MVLGCNTKYTGKGMLAAPRADVADGKIDVLVVRNASRRQMLRLFQGVFDGSHITLPCVEYYQVQSFRLEPEAEDLVNLDGELKYHAPISVEVCPGAVQIFQTASRCS
jgi:diacylglycerol kinase family enzyme